MTSLMSPAEALPTETKITTYIQGSKETIVNARSSNLPKSRKCQRVDRKRSDMSVTVCLENELRNNLFRLVQKKRHARA
jgi:hypothetical protein